MQGRQQFKVLEWHYFGWCMENKLINEDACWLDEVTDRMGNLEKQEELNISVKDVENGIWKIVSWKSLCPDGVRGFWFKRFEL